MPNGHHIESIGTTNINWPTLPNTATKAHILPELNPHSLVSIGILCDHDCTATFTKHAFTIHRHNQPILTGPCLPNGLWCLPLHHDQTQHHTNTLFTPKTQQQLVQWLLQSPSVPVLALSSTQSNATSSQLGQASPPTSSDTISPHPTPLLKATSTNNNNANANILVPMNNQSLQAAPALTPSMPPFLTPRPPLAAPTAISPAAFQSNQIVAPTTSS